MASRPLAALLAMLAVAACGDRSGLIAAEAPFTGGTPLPSQDGGVHPPRDATAPMDVHDASTTRDATPLDHFTADVVDASDAAETSVTTMPEAGVACTDGGFPLAYVLDFSGAFYTFDPATLATNLIGTPACGDDQGVWDFSVSREGDAYVIFEDWNIFKVDLRTLACSPTSFVNGQLGFEGDFTSAVVPTAQGEEMLFYGAAQDFDLPTLARSDLQSFVLTDVGDVIPVPPQGAAVADVKADAFGRLFGLSSSGVFMQIDPTTAALIHAQTTAFSSGSWALLLFGRDVYFFGGSTVFHYDPATLVLTQLGTVTPTVIGASAVPCFHVP